jgi:hypothetical protein
MGGTLNNTAFHTFKLMVMFVNTLLKSRRMRWNRLVARIREIKNIYYFSLKTSREESNWGN